LLLSGSGLLPSALADGKLPSLARLNHINLYNQLHPILS
jgi:hypothetical protein